MRSGGRAHTRQSQTGEDLPQIAEWARQSRLHFQHFVIFIRLEARLQPNIGFTFERASCIHDFTDFRQPNVTKFEHNTSIGVATNPFGTEF